MDSSQTAEQNNHVSQWWTLRESYRFRVISASLFRQCCPAKDDDACQRKQFVALDTSLCPHCTVPVCLSTRPATCYNYNNNKVYSYMSEIILFPDFSMEKCSIPLLWPSSSVPLGTAKLGAKVNSSMRDQQVCATTNHRQERADNPLYWLDQGSPLPPRPKQGFPLFVVLCGCDF